ncbi:MAG: tRNA (5-methylaminomethyl-2-thiouridine)(34)-methyltransferase MnmD [Flavobacteriales bacterium]|nr:tRNA (5-methylaminomethyl-2-thiouridine)(34)-methyltransferase MnmD [Flavobacteriales bacterium]MCW8912278.1 tRNA (5-methylaminomethyl-2-thiouridine)(34)-methyltransferase MnmD [Flavobacteriales bacterium]MCW8937483.1 tRNA (5-methylaminomethyl-2-thiouridine)(34)-methyltransferase MnmD [Flavobacteriales bacterium]MCW8967192.1 tRNA (5-methylaminomethyl-2-thiouridine)(34)-methyltransferase MnmD [Flavobacteriales bacterium]MCW8989106.1 tRNA (5-methylaminomethyl-2-thiouridine)(34)-methyltransfera
MELKKTADGSHTLFVPELNETYHSIHGAIQESQHVFIKNGLHYFGDKKTVNILEIGFGTGLNALLTLLAIENSSQKVDYISLEKFPLPNELVQQLNYPTQLKLDTDQKKLFNHLYICEWNALTPITNNFNLLKIDKDLADFQYETIFDIVYFDAFAPEKQAELWTDEIFSKIYDFLKPKGILVTYCAKGVVKRTIKSVGFQLETLPGPPGKREMIRAIKN